MSPVEDHLKDYISYYRVLTEVLMWDSDWSNKPKCTDVEEYQHS